MGYQERKVDLAAALTIDDESYDLDYFGMDDGASDGPGAAFRFIFQLGSGWMIYLYVIQAGAGGGRHDHFFHTFWIKDCAVAEVDLEDLGAPRSVAGARCALPLLYQQVALVEDGASRAYAITAQAFEAVAPDAAEMTFELAGGARLRWTRARAWELIEPPAAPRPLRSSERLRFT